jgi:uncharacterized membrane protein
MNKPKRNRTMILLLLPVVIAIFVVGWVMYWVGEPRGARKPEATGTITIGAFTLEENGRIHVC